MQRNKNRLITFYNYISLTEKSMVIIFNISNYCFIRLIYFKSRYIRLKGSIYNDYLIVFYRLYNRYSIN